MSKRFWCFRTFLSVHGFKKRSYDCLIKKKRFSNAGKTHSLAGVSLPFGKGFRCKEKKNDVCTVSSKPCLLPIAVAAVPRLHI